MIQVFAAMMVLANSAYYEPSPYQYAIKRYYLNEQGHLKQGDPAALKEILRSLDSSHPDIIALWNLYAVETEEIGAWERLLEGIGGQDKISAFQTVDGQSLLNLAAQNGLSKVTQALLHHGYDINRSAQICSDGSELTSSLVALMLKAQTDTAFKPLALQILLDKRLDPHKKTSVVNGNSPIWCALDMAKLTDDYDFMHLLLAEYPHLANAHNEMNGNSILFDAVNHNNITLAALLIYYGADTNQLYDKRVPLVDCTKDPVMIRLLKKQISPKQFLKGIL